MAKKEVESKGILLIAAGHANYGNYALQLAMSLRSNSSIQISIAYAQNGISHLTDVDRAIFDKVIEIPEKYYKTGNRNTYLKSKLFLYQLSPYSETLFLDADMLWLPKQSVDIIFEELKDIDFTMQNRGAVDINENNGKFITWADTKEIKEAYGFEKGKLFHLSSEFVYFKKTKEVKALFEQTKKEYENLKVKHTFFAGWVPDELPFAIAMIKNNIYPHKENFVPVFWQAFEKKRLEPVELYATYYAYSLGGATYDTHVKTFYNNLAQYYCNLFGKKAFPLKDKRSYLPERTNI